MKLYEIEKIELENVDSSFAQAWVGLVRESPRASFFSQLHYLKIIQHVFNKKIDLWYIRAGDKLRAGGVLFPHHILPRLITNLYYVPYNGILIRELPEEHNTKKIIRRNSVYSSFQKFIKDNYSYANFIFSPEHKDLREFAIKKRWNIKLKYTFYIDISNIDKVYKNIQRGERRRIKNFISKGKNVQSFIPEEFADLIFFSYERHRMLPPVTYQELRSWLLDLQLLSGIHFMGITDENNKLKSGLLWAEFKNRAYFLLTGSDLNDGVSYSPYLFYRVFSLLNERGFTTVDLLGGTHKSVSVFKMHMGGVPEAYYEVLYSQNFLYGLSVHLKEVVSKVKRRL